MKKSVNKIIVASVALIVALGLAVGTSFAWFTMNNSVTVTGMLVNTQVATNLFIADDNAAGLASTAILNQEDFGSSVTITSNATQLEPVSTTDGKHFF
ncbi:MAG: hypothetical protein J6Z34_06320, partial [Clostridia bacterium]|nr:hypothetical protein [Clostridia bacterium]